MHNTFGYGFANILQLCGGGRVAVEQPVISYSIDCLAQTIYLPLAMFNTTFATSLPLYHRCTGTFLRANDQIYLSIYRAGPIAIETLLQNYIVF